MPVGYNYHLPPGSVSSGPGTGDGPPLGTYNSPSHSPTAGYANSAPNATHVNAPGGFDYTEWDWEQVLYGVLGLNLPDRSLVTGMRWTASDSKGEGSSLYQIFEARWITGDILVYLNPDVQDAGGPWDEYYNTPYHQLWQVFVQSSANANYATIPLDPREFNTVAAGLAGVEATYNTAASYFNGLTNDLNSEAAQFK